MTISAKYCGTCVQCGQSFPAGTEINWEKGVGSSHAECPAVEATAGIEYLLGYTSAGAAYEPCGDRTDEFVARAAAFNGVTPDEIRQQLAAGKTTGYSQGEISTYHLRDAAIAAAKKLAVGATLAARRAAGASSRMCCRSCGQTGSRGSYPFSTNPGSGRCDDCC
jgi:hypothetical protein